MAIIETTLSGTGKNITSLAALDTFTATRTTKFGASIILSNLNTGGNATFTYQLRHLDASNNILRIQEVTQHKYQASSAYDGYEFESWTVLVGQKISVWVASTNNQDTNVSFTVHIIDQTAANVYAIDDQLTSGNNATLYLKQLNIVNSNGDGIYSQSTGGNGRGAQFLGHGTSAGVRFQGGSTGPGVMCVGGSISGAGFWTTATNGHGFHTTGGGTNNGFRVEAGTIASAWRLVGGTISGQALNATTTNGDAFFLSSGGTNSFGFNAIGAGTGAGGRWAGGVDGPGMIFVGGSNSGNAIGMQSVGNGIGITTTGPNSNAIRAIGSGTGPAVVLISGDSSGTSALQLQSLLGTGISFSTGSFQLDMTNWNGVNVPSILSSINANLNGLLEVDGVDTSTALSAMLAVLCGVTTVNGSIVSFKKRDGTTEQVQVTVGTTSGVRVSSTIA